MADPDSKIAIIMNRKAGVNLDGGSEALEARLREAVGSLGQVVGVEHVEGDDLPKAVESAAGREDVDIVVMAGGDGSVSCAARECVKAGKVLLPLPFGTYNLVCRSLGLPNDAEAAIEAIGRMTPAAVDVGEANGEVFLHHISIGLHPRFIDERNAAPYRSRFGKMGAAAGAVVRVLKSVSRRPIRMAIDGTRKTRWLAGLGIAVNRIAETPGMTALIDNPAGGRLAIYLTDIRSGWGALVLLVRYMAGSRGTGPYLEVKSASQVVLEGPGSSLRVSMDGETRRLDLPLKVELHHRALKVLALREDARQPADAT